MTRDLSTESTAVYDWSTLDKREGLVLRGVGILLIMMHNFTHWVPPVTGENEFHFDARHFDTALEQVLAAPWDGWRILFSYFGHYGVQLFVFLSAFGLTKSLLSNDAGYTSFLWKRLTALYPAVIIAAVTFLVYNSIVAGPGKTLGESIVPLMRQFFLIGNFTGHGFTPIGPWWFLSMICQFYVVFPLLFRGLERLGSRILLVFGVAAILAELFLNGTIAAATNINLNYTVVGHLAEFCLGMWAARSGRMKAPAIWIVIAAGIFVAGQLNSIAWLLSGLAFIILTVPLLRVIAAGSGRVPQLLAFYGTLSLHLFLMNGFLRNPLVWLAQIRAQDGAPYAWLSTIVWSLLFLLSCTIFAWAGARAERALRNFSA